MMDISERVKKYFELVYRYLSLRSRSEKEIRDYLTKKQAATEIIEHIISSLKKHKFLDDEVFARSWVLSRARSRPKGKSAVKFELQQKGITKDIIEKVMNEVNEEVPDQVTLAKRLIAKRIDKLKDQPRQVIYNKVGSFLARRGFDWDTIKQSIDEDLKNRV
jgi:regulatory protein